MNGIAKVLAKRLLTEAYQQQAKAIAARIDKEPGIDKAVNLIEKWL